MDQKMIIGIIGVVAVVAVIAGVSIGLSGSDDIKDDGTSVSITVDLMEGYEIRLYVEDEDGKEMSGNDTVLENGKTFKIEYNKDYFYTLNLKSVNGYKFDAFQKETSESGMQYGLTVNDGVSRHSYTLTSDNADIYCYGPKGYYGHYEDNVDIDIYPEEGSTFHIRFNA